MPTYAGGMSNDLNRPGTYRPRHPAPDYRSVRQGWREARYPATQVLTTLLVGLFLLCGIYHFAASGLGPVRHGAHPAPSTPQGQAQSAQEAPAPQLLDPSVGRGADSPACRHAARSPRCRLEGGQGLSLPRKGDGRALQPATDDGQTVLLQEDVTSPRPMPHRVPGRGGWVSEQGRSQA